MESFLQSITESKLFVTLVGLLVANFGTIISFVGVAIKQMLKRKSAADEYQKQCEAYLKQAKEAFAQTASEMEIQMQAMVKRLTDTQQAIEDAKKEELNQNALKLEEAIKETKSSLATDIESIMNE